MSMPVVLLLQLQRLLSDVPNAHPGLRGVTLDQVFRQDRNVVQALAQGRDPDGKDVQPIEEVLTKPTTLDSGLEIAVGGGDDRHIEGNQMTAPQPSEPPFLHEPST